MLPVGGEGGRAGAEGAGCCQLGGGEGGHWPAHMGSSGGLGGALLGSWAGLTAGGCGSPATGNGGNLATPPTFTIRPYTPVPFNARGWPFTRHGHCCSLATRGCPSSHPASCWATPAGEPAERLEAPELWWDGAGGGHGEGGVADTSLRHCQPGLAMALPAPMLPPPQSPLPGRGRHLAPGSRGREIVL